MLYYFTSDNDNLKGYLPLKNLGKIKKNTPQSNIIVALLYADKSLNDYPFKINKNGKVVYTQKNKDQFINSYKNKNCYLYTAKQEENINFQSNYVSEIPVLITNSIFIDDLYNILQDFVEKGELIIN